MRWVRGRVEAKELRLVPSVRRSCDEHDALVQMPRSWEGPLHLVIVVGGDESGSGSSYLVRHLAKAEEGAFTELASVGDQIRGRISVAIRAKRLAAYATRWGLPLLPEMWDLDLRDEIVTAYCYPLEELTRLSVLASVLRHLLRARYGGRKRELQQSLLDIGQLPSEQLIPLGVLRGGWDNPIPLRDRPGRAHIYRAPKEPLPPLLPPRSALEPTGPDGIPPALQFDPFLPLRHLNAAAPRDILGRPRAHLWACYNDLAFGIHAYVVTRPLSLLSFILGEWLQLNARRNGVPYCRYEMADGEVCGAPLPHTSSINRLYCDEHRRVRARERVKDSRGSRSR